MYNYNNTSTYHDVYEYTWWHCTVATSDTRLDKCLVNIKDSYKSSILPPLGESDHGMIHLIPKYRQLLKRQPPVKRTIRTWTIDAMDILQGCLYSTIWDTLTPEDQSLDENVEVVADYINFCVSVVIPSKTVTQYPNNKPWVTKDFKELVNRKKRAVASGNKGEVRTIKCDLKIWVWNAKTHTEIKWKNSLIKKTLRKPGQH